nr:hypothetical protein BaRGS_012028 [Batillaria attramentaria]
MREKEKIIKRMASMPAYSRTDSVGSEGSGRAVDRQLSMNGMNISFDEPLYNRNSVHSTEQVGEDNVQDSSSQRFFPSEQYGQEDKMERKMNEMTVNDRETEKMEEQNKMQAATTDVPEPSKRAPKFTTTKRRSSTVDEMLFDDYVEPDEPDADAVFAPENLPSDLMSFDQDVDNVGSKRSPRHSQSSVDSNGGRNNNLYTSTSVESSDAEYGGESVPRSASRDSEKSWSSTYSIDSQPDEVTLECMEFMKKFVEKVFSTE